MTGSCSTAGSTANGTPAPSSGSDLRLPQGEHIPFFLAEADEELTAHWKPTADSDGEVCYPGREQIGFTTYEQIKTGTWRIRQVSERAEPHRRHGEPTTREQVFDVPALFAGPVAATPTETLPAAF